ncbi:MAG: hypothetical protein ACYDCH_15135, partial [Gaiellaceae bacterium]
MRLPSAARLRGRLPARLPWEPWSVLVPLVVVEWIGIAVEARRIPHDRWLFAANPLATWEGTTSWILGSGHTPHTLVGYGLPLLVAPITWLTGPSFIAVLPVVVILQVGVLLPLAVLGMYALGARAAGRLAGYLAAAVWTLAPFVSTWYFALHHRWRGEILPELLGLTLRPALIGAVFVLAAGVLVLRSLDERRPIDAAAAAVAASFAVALEPANVVFFAAPVLSFVAARRFRDLLFFAAAVVPCAVTYVVWSIRSVGHASLLLPSPAHISWHEWSVNFAVLNDVSWSPRVLEWIAVAGVVGLLKRDAVKALFFATWIAGYVVSEGASGAERGFDVAFWHVFMGAFPAWCALAASIPLLWPRPGREAMLLPYRPRHMLSAVVPAVAFVLVPLVAVVIATPLKSRSTAATIERRFVPINRGVIPDASVVGRRVALRWQPLGTKNARIFYAVFRSSGRGRDLICTTHGAGATGCAIQMTRVG